MKLYSSQIVVEDGVMQEGRDKHLPSYFEEWKGFSTESKSVETPLTFQKSL